MYKYLRSLNVLNNFTINSLLASTIISFSDIICCCWRVSTICAFFICFNAYDRVVSFFICTNSTLPNPPKFFFFFLKILFNENVHLPTPKVAIIRRSVKRTSRNSSFILKNRKKVSYQVKNKFIYILPHFLN